MKKIVKISFAAFAAASLFFACSKAEVAPSESAASGEQVKYTAFRNIRLQDIKHVFTDPVKGGPCIPPGRRFYSSAPSFTGYDSHK